MLQAHDFAMSHLDHLLYVTPRDKQLATQLAPSANGGAAQARNSADCPSLSDAIEQVNDSEASDSERASAAELVAMLQPNPWQELPSPSPQQMQSFMSSALRTAALDVLVCGALDGAEAIAVGKAASARLHDAAAAAAGNGARGQAAHAHNGTAACTGNSVAQSQVTSEQEPESTSQPAPQAAAGSSPTANGSIAKQSQHSAQQTGASTASEPAANAAESGAAGAPILHFHKLPEAVRPPQPHPVVALQPGTVHVHRCTMQHSTLNAAAVYYQVHQVCVWSACTAVCALCSGRSRVAAR